MGIKQNKKFECIYTEGFKSVLKFSWKMLLNEIVSTIRSTNYNECISVWFLCKCVIYLSCVAWKTYASVCGVIYAASSIILLIIVSTNTSKGLKSGFIIQPHIFHEILLATNSNESAQIVLRAAGFLGSIWCFAWIWYGGFISL